MTSEKLEESCLNKFGKLPGRKLYYTMMNIAKKDFCVATGWTDREVSIARGCLNPGRIFYLTEDYQALIFPGLDNMPVPIDSIGYTDFRVFLPSGSSRGEQRHCSVDD
jgi:hypothetical protein